MEAIGQMIYQRNSGIVKRQIAGETFLIPVRNRLADMRNIYVLHGIGEFIWDRLDRDSESICSEIVQHFDIDADKARHDLEEHLRELEAADLVTAGK